MESNICGRFERLNGMSLGKEVPRLGLMAHKQKVRVGNRELTVSNTRKVFFSATGFTKGEVIAFYSEIADVILPHLRDRPLTLKR